MQPLCSVINPPKLIHANIVQPKAPDNIILLKQNHNYNSIWQINSQDTHGVDNSILFHIQGGYSNFFE